MIGVARCRPIERLGNALYRFCCLAAGIVALGALAILFGTGKVSAIVFAAAGHATRPQRAPAAPRYPKSWGANLAEVLAKKRSAWSWLLWWETDQSELEAQVVNYKSLSILKSARGQAIICLLFSMAITMTSALLKTIDLDALVDAWLFAILAVFIYFGHRWAMITAMMLWTVEKGYYLYGLGNGSSTGTTDATQIIWWCIYMHAFYFAFRVEQGRGKQVAAAAA